jgi:glycosidase
MKDKNSLFDHYKTLIHLRNSSKALTYGELEPVSLENKELFAFLRTTDNESVLVLHNISKTDVTFNLPGNLEGYNKLVFRNKNAVLKNYTLQIPAYSTLILKK